MRIGQFKGELVALIFQMIFILYALSGVVYENGLITNILMIFSVLLSTYYCVLSNLRYSNKFLRILTIFITLYVIYFFLSSNQIVFSIVGTPITKLYTLKVVLFAISSFFPFYYIANKYDYSIYNKKIVLFYLILFFISIVKYITRRNELDFEGVEGGLNVAYTFVACLPIAAIFMKKKFIYYTIIGILMLLIIAAMKRGAIIVGLMMILVCIYHALKMKSKVNSNRITNVIVVIFFAAILSLVAYNSVVTNEALLNRFAEISEGGSGRDMIYTTLLNKWIEPDDATSFLFGYGMNATVKFTGFFAHNDWLEVAITCGLLGVIIYIMMIYRLYKYGKTNEDYIGKTIVMMIVVAWLVSSLFSMFYSSTLTFVYMMLTGIILGNNDRKIRKNFNN